MRAMKPIMTSTVVLSFLLMLALVVIALSFTQAHNQACASRNTTLQVLNDILVLTRPTASDRAHMTPAQVFREDAFYEQAQRRIVEARCS